MYDRTHLWLAALCGALATALVFIIGLAKADEVFSSDREAYEEFLRTVAEEGMAAFLNSGNVIPFRR